jgi:hypothetical protein
MFVFAMTYPAYLRERARELRVKKRLSLDEIAEWLALPKTTIYYWIRDLALGRERRWSVGQRIGNLSMQAKYRRMREDAYAQGLVEYDELVLVPTFRDFVVLYIAEGYKRCRNVASIGNSDDRVVAMSAGWLQRVSVRKLFYSLQYHADQDLDELREFWGGVLAIDGSVIRLQRKSNSGQLNGRTWRSAARGAHCRSERHASPRAAPRLDRPRSGRLGSRLGGTIRGVAKPGYRTRLGRGRPPVQIRAPRSCRFEKPVSKRSLRPPAASPMPAASGASPGTGSGRASGRS